MYDRCGSVFVIATSTTIAAAAVMLSVRRDMSAVLYRWVARAMRGAGFVVLFLFCSMALADECTQIDARVAETVTDYLDSWENVAIAFKQFGKCDDGSVAEGFSDKISRLLSEHWTLLPQLVRLTEKTRGLEAFILNHLDETVSLNDARKIATLAYGSCPSTARALCTKIRAKLGDVEHVHRPGA
jgi:hypothetical protein